ncbi:BspA family leucine-rich repeat surface protein [Bacteroidota bacterium]
MFKRSILIFQFLLVVTFTNAQMILEFDTRLSEGTTVTLPLYGTVDVTVDWGDGSIESITIADKINHIYSVDSNYTVEISGLLTRFGNSLRVCPNIDKLIKCKSFGDIGIMTLYGAFKNATNLIEVPDEIPTTVINLSYIFHNDTSFNEDISNWDVSSVVNMDGMFSNATSFNQDIGNWDVSNVTYMNRMFINATSFNQDIGNWNVGNVTDMFRMFDEASSFNQDIGNWDVSNVVTMQGMFSNATSFNQDIGNWDVSSVTDMSNMFRYANSFDQDIGDWNVRNTEYMLNMFSGVRLSNAYYDSLLIKWSKKSLLKDVNFDAGNSRYFPGNASNARQYIIDTYDWNIIDGGILCIPTIITDTIKDIQFNSAISGGDITDDGGSDIVSGGIIWDTIPNPSIDNSIDSTVSGLGLGVFIDSLTNLFAGKMYYVRAYAINSVGTGYGDQLQFIPQQKLTINGHFTSQNKIYDGLDTATIVTDSLSLIGIVSGHEDVRINEVKLVFEDKNVGNSKNITIKEITLNGSDSLKYSIIYEGSPSSTADITRKELTISIIDAISKVYDGLITISISYATLEGAIENDDISILDTLCYFENKNVGTSKSVSAAITLAGTDTINYSLTQPTELTADITPKTITISGSFTVENKEYDESTDATIKESNLVLEGVISSDLVTLSNLVLDFSQAEVGNDILITITEADLLSDDAQNYILSLEDAPTTLANIIEPVGIDEINNFELSVYPNPFIDRLNISVQSEISSIKVTTLNGKVLIYNESLVNENINLNQLSRGVYLVNVLLKNEQVKTFKVIKK